MRTELAKFAGQRNWFRARIEDIGTGRSSSRRETILLVEVRCTDDLDAVVADHIWIKKGGQFQAVSIGDVIEFDAEVEQYEKGYMNFRMGIDETTIDYRLSKPSNVQAIADSE